MVSGQPPALTPPPSTPAPAYGYPHQPQHPSGFGPTPPYGPGGGYLPPPEPPRRSGRSTAALIVVALIVAIGAGGTVYAVMNDEGTDDAKNTDAKNSASSAPATPGPTSPSAEPSERASASSSAEEGTVPEKYLGTWNGGLKSDAGRSTRQLTLQQGEVGDTVLSVTADGPAKGGGTYHCVFQGKLESASDDRLHIGPTEVIVGEPMTSCTPGSPTVVTILGNGKLRRANTDGSGELTYDRAN